MSRSRIDRHGTQAGLKSLVSLACLAACMAAHAAVASAAAPPAEESSPAPAAPWRPVAAFTQLGVADEVTAATAGVIWNLHRDALPAPWSLYFEGSLSRWHSRGGYPSDHGVLTQVALVPVFRWRAGQGGSAWFCEGGIGATVTSSVYRHADKHFSTSFNFGDHVGMGYSFGTAWKNEVALRFEHFSNAGIKHPNPGQNFTELRYVRRFD